MPSDSDSDTSFVVRKRRKLKRSDNKSGRKINTSLDHIPRIHELSFDPLLYPPSGNIATDEDFAFDETIQKLLPDFLDTRLSLQEQELERDQQGAYLRNLTRAEVSSLLTTGEKWAHYASTSLLLRKLKLSQERRRSHITPNILVASTNPLQQNRSTPEQTVPRPRVVDALEDIETTPFENSFLSRLQGTRKAAFPSLIAVDWETITPWMCLMRDVRNHYRLAHPERQQPIESLAPITYCTLQACHLNQIHDLLERVFWTGIDVSDSLEYSPERCTVVACYERLVVGVAILSSPQETYITYLAVKAGWDKAQIARLALTGTPYYTCHSKTLRLSQDHALLSDQDES